MKIAFFATPDIALESFKYFIDSNDYEVCALVTQPPKPSCRGKKIIQSKIKTMALENGIEVFEPHKISKEPDIIEKLKSFECDFFVTFAFGQILSQEVIDIPKFVTINLHASLLPCYRGANPICEAILNGDKITGITTMKTTLELDAGDICLQEEINLDDDITTPELMKKISSLSPALLDKTLKGLYEGTLKTKPQDCTKATFTKKITKDEKNIDWNNDAKKIHDKIRAMNTINTCHTNFGGKIIKILKTKVVDSDKNARCGEVICVNKEGVCVCCANKAILLLSVKPEGKGEMSAYNWSLGAKIKAGDILGQC